MGKALCIKGVDFSAVALDKVDIMGSIPCTGIELSPSSLSFDTHDESKTVTATLIPTNTTDNLEWTSSNENVATVENGVVTIHGIGTATITAKCGEAEETITITQTMLKQKRPLYEANGVYPERISSSNNVIRISRNSSNAMFAQDKNTADTDLQIYGTTSTLVEMVPVPYGATICKVASKTDSFWIAYMLYANRSNLIEYSGGNYPEYIKSESGFYSATGKAVEYGQCVAFRIEATYFGKPDYIYFE